MKNIFAIGLSFLMILGSCSEDFFNINDDPNGPDKTTPNLMLPNVIQSAMTMMSTTSFVATTITQQRTFNENSGISSARNWLSFSWSPYAFQNNYWQTGSNNEAMMRWAEEEGSWHHVAAGQVIKAFSFSVTTDFYGPVYFSEAFSGIAQPKFDDQEFVYQQCLELCDLAINNFERTDVFRPLEQGDIMYNGDISKWIKFAYAVKARLLNHLTKKAEYDADLILSFVDKSFTNTLDDAGFEYPDGGAFENLSNDWSNDYFFYNNSEWNKYFVDHLKGEYSEVIDPRLPLIVNPASDGEYRGVTNGFTLDDLADPSLVSPTEGKYYTSPSTPYPLMTYEEVKFIEAEASFLKNNKSRAYLAYIEGIKANMKKLGVTEESINAYLNSKAVAASPTELDLSDIMVQKYLALGLNPELWVDMRRYDYSTDIYPGLSQPADANPSFGGKWIRRMEVFSTEVNFNPEEVSRIGGLEADYMSRPVWWDQ